MIVKPKHPDLYITNNSIIVEDSIYHNVFAIFATIKPIIQIMTIQSIINLQKETQVMRSDRSQHNVMIRHSSFTLSVDYNRQSYTFLIIALSASLYKAHRNDAAAI